MALLPFKILYGLNEFNCWNDVAQKWPETDIVFWPTE